MEQLQKTNASNERPGRTMEENDGGGVGGQRKRTKVSIGTEDYEGRTMKENDGGEVGGQRNGQR